MSTMPADYAAFFRTATGFEPYPYQRRLASRPAELMHVPTGMGKTEAVLLAWLWRRRQEEGEPRRLVWCLPMRTLVEQTRDRMEGCFERLQAGGVIDRAPGVHVLMGGEGAGDWADRPEEEQVLLGTQDMLLSRALNRGYAASRYRWPREFGLLHSDVLWVFDEVQLMGAALPTTTQLEAFRQAWGHLGPARSLWMSATLRPEWLSSVDFAPHVSDLRRLELDDEDRAAVRHRLEAPKDLARVEPVAPSKKAQIKEYAQAAASMLLEEHAPGTFSLCVVNTVGRAQAVHAALARAQPSTAELLLLHSRYRPADRRAVVRQLLDDVPEAGRIAVCTQVVEAGVDLSARLLVTELAPWSSLVQRFGRCNRDGMVEDARILWCDVEEGAEAPYEPADMAAARERLSATTSAAPIDLSPVDGERRPSIVLRRRDLEDLFDTDPDLCGADVDISRYVRETDQRDVRVFWRELPPEGPETTWRPGPEELCPVPIGELRAFLEKQAELRRRAFLFDAIDGRWQGLDREALGRLVPGRVVLLDAELGGYDPGRGWVGRDGKRAVSPIEVPAEPPSEEWSQGDDPRSFAGVWVPLDVHLDDVVGAAELLLAELEDLGISADHREAVLDACRWHDAGKAHAVFQETLAKGLDEEERSARGGTLWAKAAGGGRRHRRPGFRHELASALAALEAGHSDLVAYLVAAHHGKVRMAIRSLPDEPACSQGSRHARGVHEHDELPATSLGGGILLPATRMDLSIMEMGLDDRGRPSWQDRMLKLRDGLGPFVLAFLEGLVRVADARASASPTLVEEAQRA